MNADEFGTGSVIIVIVMVSFEDVIIDAHGFEYALKEESELFVFVPELVKLRLCLFTDGFEVVLSALDFEDEDEADKGCPSDFSIVLLK